MHERRSREAPSTAAVAGPDTAPMREAAMASSETRTRMAVVSVAVLCACVVLSGCASFGRKPIAVAHISWQAGYVRVANFSGSTLSVSVGARSLPAIDTGATTGYIWQSDVLAPVRVSERGSLWAGIGLVTQEAKSRSMFLLEGRRRLLTLNDPTAAPAGSSVVQTVNADAEPVRFEFEPIGKSGRRPKAVSVPGLDRKDRVQVKAGRYRVRAVTKKGRIVEFHGELVGGKGYSAVAYLVGGKPRIALLENGLADAPAETDAGGKAPILSVAMSTDSA